MATVHRGMRPSAGSVDPYSKTTTRHGAAIIASTRCWCLECCFQTRRIDESDPGIEDMAATALWLFGVPRPAWMEGKPVFRAA